MADDSNELFSRCLGLFVQGMRQAVRERLESRLGEAWWEQGVLPALSEEQRGSLRVGIEREKRGDLSHYLDVGYFPGIVKRNHAAAFADAFPDIDSAVGRFRRIKDVRNEWAHFRPGGLEVSNVRAAIDAMRSLLIAMRCREALEIDEMTNQRSGNAQSAGDSASSETAPSPSDEKPNEERGGEEPRYLAAFSRLSAPVSFVSDEELDEGPNASLDFWRGLQSYLALDSSVSNLGEERMGQTQVTVRVSNVAPVGEGSPEVYFREGYLSVKGSGRDQALKLGELHPGQTVQREFTFHPNTLASVAFEVRGDLDVGRFFRLRRIVGMPSEVVAPLMQGFAQQFADIRIREPLDEALSAVRSVGPGMTLADAQQVRQALQRAPVLLAEKEKGLQNLFHDFHLTKQTRLGAHCHEVWRLLREVGSRIQAVDTAIEGTDPQAAGEAVRSLEDLKLALLQVEETTRSMGV